MPVDVAAFNPPGSCRAIVMPGRTVVDPKIVREVGTEVSISRSRRAPTLVFSTSTVGDEPLTVTVSCSDASFISASTVIVWRTGTTMPSRIIGAKPASSNLSVYVPELTAGKRYKPLALVVAVGLPMTAGPDSVTVTPGSTPPWSSVTFPTSSPNVWPVCAAAGARPNVDRIASAASARMNVPFTGDLLLGTPMTGVPERIRGLIPFLATKVASRAVEPQQDTGNWIVFLISALRYH